MQIDGYAEASSKDGVIKLLPLRVAEQTNAEAGNTTTISIPISITIRSLVGWSL